MAEAVDDTEEVIQHLDAHGTRVTGTEKLRRVAQLYVDHSRGPGSDAEADFLFDFYAALDAHGDYVKQDEDVEREADIRAAGWDLECVTPRAMRERPRATIERLIRFLQS